MVWIAVGVVLVSVLLVAWRMDRRRKVTIDYDNPALQQERAQAQFQAQVHRTSDANQGWL